MHGLRNWRFHALDELRAYRTIYLSLAPRLAWLFVRQGLSPMAIFSVNPRLRWGGCGFDTKYERYELFADSPIAIPTVLIESGAVFHEEAIRALLAHQGLEPPLIAKPNRGHSSRGIRTLTSVADALALFGTNRTGDYLLQPFVADPHAFSIFYGRMPGQKGRILDLTERVLSRVEGEVPLTVAPRRPGGVRFVHRPELITEALERLIDVSATAVDFHFGKLDVKAPSREALARGQRIKLLDVDGSTARLTSIFDESFTFWTARRAVLGHAEFLTAVGRQLPARAGRARPTVRQLYREWDQWRTLTRQ